MVPSLQDWRDFIAHQKWFFGHGPKPQFDRWTYWEKFDYFAVFWGVAVIGLSGLLLEQADVVREAYAPWFELDPTVGREDWAFISGRRRP